MAERTFPWRVDISVPGFGLGRRLNAMHAWCRERGGEYAQHGFMVPRPGEIPRDVVRFYFMTEADTLAFRARWGGEVSEMTPRRSTIA